MRVGEGAEVGTGEGSLVVTVDGESSHSGGSSGASRVLEVEDKEDNSETDDDNIEDETTSQNDSIVRDMPPATRNSRKVAFNHIGSVSSPLISSILTT